MTNSTDTGKIAQLTPPGTVLYRTRTEICRILQFLVSDRCPVSAEIGDNQTFVSKVLFVDHAAGYFVVAYSADKSANSELFGPSSLKFTSNPHGGHLEFQVSGPTDMHFAGKPAIQFALPQSVVHNHRREQTRIPVPKEVSLRCIADEAGILSFEARITDINQHGMGMMLHYSADIELEPGVILEGCRIIVPGGKAIIADLEVRHTKIDTTPDGTVIKRTGVRFVQKPEGFNALIDRLARNSDKPATPK